MTVSDTAISDPMILLQGVHLELAGPAGSVKILRGIDLAVGAGETVSVVGPSGSGKTTMLMVIAGLERPTAGEIRVKGVDLGTLDEDGLALFRRRNMGIVFQNFHLVPTMTAIENVAIPSEFAGHENAFDRARDNLVAVGLGHRLGHYPAQLSGGEQQRVALARAFVGSPGVLLADEPTGNLDHATGEAIIDLLFSMAGKNGTTLLLITHDSAIGTRCTREIRIADGLASDGPSAAMPAR